MTGPREPEPELSEIEWLDGDPAGPADPGHPPRIPRFAWYALIAVVIAAVVIVLTVSRGNSTHQASPSPTPTTPSTRPTPTSPTPTPPTSTPPVTVRSLGHPLLDVPRGVELFARSGGTVLRVELANGRITRTTGVELSAGGSASMVPTRHALLLMASDPGVGVPGAGFLVPDGQPARPLAQRLTRNGGTLLPGPDPDHVWLVSYTTAQAQLVGVDGRPSGVTIPIGGFVPDGTGNLIASLNGGVYLARPGAPLQRITTGALVAAGPTRWLTEECDVEHNCTLEAIDRATGAHHLLGHTDDRFDPIGQISPDGSIVAIAHADREQASTTLQFIDLASGALRNSVLLATSNDFGAHQFAWTPDSRWLLAIDQRGRIVAIDRVGRVRVLTGGDTVVTQLALRVP